MVIPPQARPAPVALNPVLAINARLTPIVTPARADIKQVLAAAVLHYREQHQRNVPAAQLPVPATSVKLPAVRAVLREVHALAEDTTAAKAMQQHTSA